MKDNILNYIKIAMKSGDKVKLSVLRDIKSAFTEFETAKNAKPLDDAAEIGILRKLVKQREAAIEDYIKGGRQDLVDKMNEEIKILKIYLPAEISIETIKAEAEKIVVEKDMKKMGQYIKSLKEKFPTADGGEISKVVKNIINESKK